MLTIYQSNSVERLFAELTRVLVTSDTPPLEPEQVVVENPGLAHWVKIQLAEVLGIAANIEFPMPSRFFWQVQRSLMPELPDESIFSKDSLTWLIHELLPKLEQQPDFAPIFRYRQQADERRRFQLSGQIADLFDQYLVYRPDWIQQWEAELWEIDAKPLAEKNRWQAVLWWHLRAFAADRGLPLSHRASQRDEFTSLLKHLPHSHSATGVALPQQVIFFGFSAMPKHQLETLQLLAQHMDVHLMTPNPCQYYWGDILDEHQQARLRVRGREIQAADAGNNLLASLGRMGRDYQKLLLELDPEFSTVQEHSLFIDSNAQAETQTERETENQPKQLLQYIQDQILNLSEPAKQSIAIQADDSSVLVAGCHSPMREIEVLHDQLLRLFNEHSELKPQEIVVMIPDVAAYAPYIDAVFASSRPEIPYSIADRPAQAEHPLLSAFVNLVKLNASRWTLSEILSLLETPAIFKAYELTEEDIPKIKNWLQQAGIRWGIDGNNRKNQGLPNWDDNSWLHGFKRLLMGYAVGGEDPVLGVVPVPSIEGLDTQLLGPVMTFVEDLRTFHQQASLPKRITEWTPFFLNWLHRLFAPDDEDAVVLQQVQEAIESWATSVQRVKYQSAISFELVADSLIQKLQQRRGSQHFMVGKVNFCTLLPMRSIPFKVVAILGLNDSDYPRFVPPSGFDLMQYERRLGDRSRRDEDRYLFLEAITSARQSLWLSYRSRNQKDDSPLTPSVVLAELMDYLENGFYIEQNETKISKESAVEKPSVLAQIFTQHPLQPFNSTYFESGSNLQSFNQDWLAVHQPVDSTENYITASNMQADNQKSSKSPTGKTNAIELNDLLNFWQHPCRYYLNHILDVHLPGQPQLMQDDEPFSVDGLAKYQLKQKLLDRCLANRSLINAIYSDAPQSLAWLGAGQMAYGTVGQLQLNQIKEDMQPLLQQVSDVIGDKESEIVEIQTELEQGQMRLFGWQRNIFGEYLVITQPGKFKGRHLISALIQQCALIASGYNKQAIILCEDQVVWLQLPSKAQAVNLLNQYVAYFLKGQLAPLAFISETAWQWANPKNKKPESAAMNAFIGTNSPKFVIPGERDDVNWLRCFSSTDEIPAELIEIADACLKPAVTENWLKIGLDIYAEPALRDLVSNSELKSDELGVENP